MNDFDFSAYDYSDVSTPLVEKKKKSKPSNDVFDFDMYEPVSEADSEEEAQAPGIIKDVAQQVASKGAQGFLGSYGNLAELLGQGKENQTPGMRARSEREFENPLESEVEDYPSYARLPTSEDIGSLIKGVTGVGEGETEAGRIAGRGAEFLGGAASIPLGLGAKAAGTAVGAGVAGQSIRELGLPEGLATGTELLTSILPAGFKGNLRPGASKKELVDSARALGLTEQEITPLIQGERKLSTLAKVARKGGKTKELFSSIKQKLGDSYDTLKSSPVSTERINPKQTTNLIQKFVDIETDLGKTLQPSPDKEGALKFINGSIQRLVNNGATPEELINFWQDINKSVKWNSIQGGKKALARLKEPIMGTLKEIDPKLAKDFEITNELYSKYINVAKKLKPDIIDSFASKAELVSFLPAAYGLATGNPWVFTGLATEAATRSLAREMLINPYFQDIGKKMVVNMNSGSQKGIETLLKQVQNHMSKKYPKEDWEFINEEPELF